MAVNAANFTFTYQQRPSIFEVLAQKSLQESLHPAFQRIALVLSTHFPEKFGWLNKYFEEAFVVLNGLVQFHYLSFYDASFSENFYGLTRISSSGDPLSRKHRELSLLFLVVVPYFKRKLDEKVTIIRLEHADGLLQKDFDGTYKKLFLHIYSVLQMAWGLFNIHNYVRYMASQTEYQTPLYQVLECKLAYHKNIDDIRFWTSLFKGTLSLSQISFGLVRNAVSTSLEVMAFFYQFLQIWNSQKSNYSITDLPNVKAPPLDNKAKKYKGICPICLKSWVIPTVLQVSGYIYCFRCILKHLNEHQRCAVTNLPAKPLDIVRLYIS